MYGRSVTVLLWNFQLHLTILVKFSWNLQNIKFASGSTCLCHMTVGSLSDRTPLDFLHSLTNFSFVHSKCRLFLLQHSSTTYCRHFALSETVSLAPAVAFGAYLAALPQRNICTTKTPICGYSCTVLFNRLDDSGLDVNLGGHRQPRASRQGVRWHPEPYLVASSVIFNI